MIAREWLQVDMLLIMNDQACARWEKLTADFVALALVTLHEQALEAGIPFLAHLVQHCNFLVRIFR